MSLQSYFPHPYMRDKQQKILEEIEQAIKSGFKYIFLEAPAGFGKSPVAIALARYLGSSHICTATKDLQAQYSRDFPFIREVKGKSNFICIIKDEMGLDETCNYGPCLKDDGYDCIYKTKLGDYKVQGEGTKYETVELDHFAQKKYIDKMKSQSKIIQFDWKPCHYYHQKLSIPYKNEYDIETWITFGTELREKLLIFIDKASTILEKNIDQYPFTEKNLIDAITKEKNLTTVIEDMRNNKDNWIVTNVEKATNNQLRKVSVTPIDVSSYFKDILDKGSISLFMSATILSKDYLCKIGGIKSDQVKFIRVHESNFPLKNRPIYLMNVAWLNAKTMNQSLPAIANAVNNIMTTHKNEKGIIHTTSYSQLRFIKENISKENAIRLIETGSKLDRNEMLEKHYNSSKPTVLISPSL